MPNIKSFNVEVKEDEGGQITGYASTFDRVPDAYGDVICMQGRMADVLSDDLGNTFYMVRLKSLQDAKRFAAFVHRRA